MREVFGNNNLFRIRIIYLFMLFCVIQTIQGQQYGVLMKHTVTTHARVPRPSHSVTLGNINYNDPIHGDGVERIVYQFFYINDNPTEIACGGSLRDAYGPGQNCGLYPVFPYNKSTFDMVTFNGCIGKSDIMGIRLAQPIDDNICVEKTINLEFGWNWQYSYDGSNWVNFSSQYQEQRTISFKINELANYSGKSRIYFRTGYGNQFINMVNYTIIPCAPKLTGSPITTNNSCDGSNDGTVTFTFDRDLVTGEYLNLTLYNNTGQVLDQELGVYEDQIINKQYQWKRGLAPGTYKLNYQTYQAGVGTNPDWSNLFTITAPAAVVFSTTYTDVICNGTANGTINISASGGTPPYSYLLDNGAAIPFTSPLTITNLSAAIHTIKVTDANGCYEK